MTPIRIRFAFRSPFRVLSSTERAVQIAHLFRELISLFERPRTRLVGKIGSQNQSIDVSSRTVRRLERFNHALGAHTPTADTSAISRFLCLLNFAGSPSRAVVDIHKNHFVLNSKREKLFLVQQ